VGPVTIATFATIVNPALPKCPSPGCAPADRSANSAPE